MQKFINYSQMSKYHLLLCNNIKQSRSLLYTVGVVRLKIFLGILIFLFTSTLCRTRIVYQVEQELNELKVNLKYYTANDFNDSSLE